MQTSFLKLLLENQLVKLIACFSLELLELRIIGMNQVLFTKLKQVAHRRYLLQLFITIWIFRAKLYVEHILNAYIAAEVLPTST